MLKIEIENKIQLEKEKKLIKKIKDEIWNQD